VEEIRNTREGVQMIIYILMFMYLALLAFLSFYFEERKREINFLIFPTFMFFLLFDGLRKSSVGGDLNVYISIFEQNSLRLPELSKIFKSRFELGYVFTNQLIRSMTENYSLLLFVFAFLTLWIWFYVLEKYSKNVYMSLIIYLSSLGMFLYSLSNIRQGLAVAFGFLGFYFLAEEKKIRGILFVLLASLFHTSGIVCILFIFIRKIKLSAKYYPTIFIGFVALFPFVKLISIALIKSFPQYNSYLESSWFLDSNKWAPILLTILYGFVFIVGEIILSKQTLTKVEESIRTFFLVYLVLTAMTLQTSLIGRFAHYFSPFVALYVPMVVSKVANRKIRWILFYGIILVYLMMLLVLIYYKPDWYHVVPYRSVITDWLIGN